MTEQNDIQWHEKYPRVFEVCTDHYLGEKVADDVLALLKEQENTDGTLNTIAKIMDALFMAFHKFSLLPDEFISPSLDMNETSKFLSGKNAKGTLHIVKGFQHKNQTHLPLQVASNLWSILAVVQPGFHRTSFETHITELDSRYLLNSMVYQLFDVLLWFKKHVDSNPKTHNWIAVNLDWIQGQVAEIHDNGRASFVSDDETLKITMPPFMLHDNKLQVGSRVEIKTNPQNKKRIKEIKKIK